MCARRCEHRPPAAVRYWFARRVHRSSKDRVSRIPADAWPAHRPALASLVTVGRRHPPGRAVNGDPQQVTRSASPAGSYRRTSLRTVWATRWPSPPNTAWSISASDSPSASVLERYVKSIHRSSTRPTAEDRPHIQGQPAEAFNASNTRSASFCDANTGVVYVVPFTDSLRRKPGRLRPGGSRSHCGRTAELDAASRVGPVVRCIA
ncbi:Uncharacterised protein [Mycobacteroides abscessus subsp. massiliense]|nr:Uncharacterised protein [Mycobacteroides abscessus subsp. massiliense]